MTAGSVRRPAFAELETFLAAARTGSLAQAGAVLHVTKTAVAKRISVLEAMVGCRLLARGPPGVTLTDAGRRFVPRVEQVLAEADRALEAIDGRRGGGDSLRIAGARSLTSGGAASTERILAEREHLFAKVFHEVADGVLIASLEDRRTLEVNDAYCRIAGFAREEIVGHAVAELGVLSAPDVEDMYASLTRDQKAAERDIAITTKSGERRTASVTARLVTLGGADRALVNVRDVTERVAREQMLRVRATEQSALAELGLRALTHATPLDLIDSAVRIVRDALSVEIVAVDQLLAGGDLRMHCTAEAANRPLVVIDSAGVGSQASFTLSSACPVISVDLSLEGRFTSAAVLMARGARSSASVVIGAPERPLGVLLAASAQPRSFSADDIVFLEGIAHVLGIAWQREAAEHELRRLGVAVEQSDDAIVVVELDGRIASWNQGAERLFGYSAGEAINARVAMLVPAQQRGEERDLLARAAAGELVRVETTRVRKHGELVLVAITLSPIRNVDGEVSSAFVIAREITALRRAERSSSGSRRQPG